MEWLTLIARLTIIAVLLAAVTHSQGARALWLKSVIALLPPLAFMLSMRLEDRPPDARFPYGRHRATVVGYLVNSLLLFTLAAYLVGSAAFHLMQGQLPRFGFVEIGNATFWRGWLVIATLGYAAALPPLISRLRRPLAYTLHDKALYADSRVGEAEWQSALAAAFGVLGVGAGLWWADNLAAGLVGLQFLRAGGRNISQALRDLIDERPRRLDTADFDPLPEHIQRKLESLDWVTGARVKMREDGRRLIAEARITVRREISPELLDDTSQRLKALDWRLLELTLVPTTSL